MRADWKTARQTPSKAVPVADQTTRIGTVWTLTRDEYTCRAELWSLQGVAGIDLRYNIDGELRETEFYRGVDGGTRATLAALDKRAELRAKGWQ